MITGSSEINEFSPYSSTNEKCAIIIKPSGHSLIGINASRNDDSSCSSSISSLKRKRKNRTAFTAHQIYELERRFSSQKYLSPADRDRISNELSLSTAQVITWFQNRRAKQKRDAEEMKNDITAAKSLSSAVSSDENDQMSNCSFSSHSILQKNYTSTTNLNLDHSGSDTSSLTSPNTSSS